MTKPAGRIIELELPKLYPKQEAAILNPKDYQGNPARFSWIEASTKSGKTHGCIAWMIDTAAKLEAGQENWWIAPIYPQAEIAFKRVIRYLPPEIFTKNESKLTVKLLTGGIICFKSGERPDGLYGEDVYNAVIDEASRLREESWFALRTTLTATKGPVRIIGNVKGRKNWFYRMSRKAQTGIAGHAYYKITAHDAVEAGVLDAEEIKSARQDLPEDVFKELYLAEPTDDGGNPFGINWIEECVMSELSTKAPVCWGWDLAKSQDFTVGIGLDENGRMCRYLRFQKPWRETKRIIIKETGDVPALLDSTGVGDPVLEDVQAECPQAEGYIFSSRSKQILMEGLANAIQSEEIAFTEDAKYELELYEYVYTRGGVKYDCPTGYHDDIVCALALAFKHFRDKGKSGGDIGFY